MIRALLPSFTSLLLLLFLLDHLEANFAADAGLRARTYEKLFALNGYNFDRRPRHVVVYGITYMFG